jgi:hypothetical protein
MAAGGANRGLTGNLNEEVTPGDSRNAGLQYALDQFRKGNLKLQNGGKLVPDSDDKGQHYTFYNTPSISPSSTNGNNSRRTGIFFFFIRVG